MNKPQTQHAATTQAHTSMPPMAYQIRRLPAVMAQTGLARSTIYLLIQQGSFPKQIRLGKNSVGWLSCDIDAWIAERMAMGHSDRTVH